MNCKIPEHAAPRLTFSKPTPPSAQLPARIRQKPRRVNRAMAGRHTVHLPLTSKSYPAGPRLIFVNRPAWTVKGRNGRPAGRFVRLEPFRLDHPGPIYWAGKIY